LKRALPAALVGAFALLLAVPAHAAPAPKTLRSYCSPSGDLCFGVFAQGRVVRFKITTAARYFSRYTLCVQAPGAGAQRCGSFPLFRGAHGTWYSTVKLSTFTSGGPGVYRVTWRIGSGPLGPSLRFRVRLH
jgi:hypothetical protein